MARILARIPSPAPSPIPVTPPEGREPPSWLCLHPAALEHPKNPGISMALRSVLPRLPLRGEKPEPLIHGFGTSESAFP